MCIRDRLTTVYNNMIRHVEEMPISISSYLKVKCSMNSHFGRGSRLSSCEIPLGLQDVVVDTPLSGVTVVFGGRYYTVRKCFFVSKVNCVTNITDIKVVV